MTISKMNKLNHEILCCSACPRLRSHCSKVAQVKRKSYRNENYWGHPITGFGDLSARLLIVGLAPGAHGANRTGRVFTGDRSGDWLYQALHKAGFSNQADSTSRTDGLKLTDVYVSCVVKCAPPDNQPSRQELLRCSTYLEREINLLKHVRVFLALGQIALNGLWPLLRTGSARPKFRHGASLPLPDGRSLLMSFHPSQQNTFTGRLTESMFDKVFRTARSVLVNRDSGHESGHPPRE